jgi:hypothetical protein
MLRVRRGSGETSSARWENSPRHRRSSRGTKAALPTDDEEVIVKHNWKEIRRFMWDYVGIVRTTKRLERAKHRIDLLASEVDEYYGNFRVTPDLIELRNLVEVARLIIRSALKRHESRGLHYTLDYPEMLERAEDTVLAPRTAAIFRPWRHDSKPKWSVLMADFTYAPEASLYQPWQQTFDASSITRQALPGGYTLWFGQLMDGNSFWFHERAGMIVSMTVSDFTTDYMTATMALPSAPLLAMLNNSQFSPGKWVNYLTGGDDNVFGSDGNDRLLGGNGVDHMFGYLGKDNLNGGNGNDVIDGGGGNDSLQGAAGDDVLIGGAGRDVLAGGAGNDTFVFDVLETSSNKDTIRDFVSGADHIELAISAFPALAGYGTGALSTGELAFGTAATAADQHLIYNSATGALYYDVDGAGGAAQVQIAQLAGASMLNAGDIVLI